MDKLAQIDQRQALLKRGTRMLATACGGNEAAGSIIGRSGEAVRRWGHIDFDETIPVYQAMLLEAECGQPVVTRLLSEMSGHGLVPREGLSVEACLREAHNDFMLEALDLSRELIEAKRDGKITPNEQAGIQRRGLAVKERVGAILNLATPGPIRPNPAPAGEGVTPIRKAGA